MCLTAIVTAVSGIGASIGSAVSGVAASSIPTAMGLSTALSVGAGALGAYGQYQNAKAMQKSANMNAAAQDQAARDAMEAGRKESDKQRRQATLARGKMRAQMAANGVDPSSQEALSFIDDERDLAETDAFTIRSNYARQAQGMANQAANYRAEASSARSAAFFEPLGTLLTTGAKVGSRYAQWSGANSYST